METKAAQENQYILFLKSEGLQKDQLQEVEKLGFNQITLRLMDFDYTEFQLKITEIINKIEEINYSYLCFNSVNALKSIEQSQKNMECLQKSIKNKQILCVGQKTLEYFQKLFPQIDQSTNVQCFKNLEVLSQNLKTDSKLNEKKVLYFVGNLTSLSEHFDMENEYKTIIDVVVSYKQVEINQEKIMDFFIKNEQKLQQLKAIVFYSKSNVQKFFTFIKLLQEQKKLEKIQSTVENCWGYIGFGKQCTKALQDQFKNSENEENQLQRIFCCNNSCFEDIVQILK